MRKLISTMWTTLDGFVSGPNDDMSFVGKFFDEEMSEYESNLVSNADTLLLGRNTYEDFAAAWPQVATNSDVSEKERTYASQLNAMRKVVFSKSLDSAQWENSEVRASLSLPFILDVKEEQGKNAIMYGSVSIVQQLTALQLIDEYHLLLHPILLGAGKPLFSNADHMIDLKLQEVRPFASGVVKLVYTPTTS